LEGKSGDRRDTSAQHVSLAIVSDIHGNLTALDAVVAHIEDRSLDRVVHGGDLALAGCQPAEVVDRVRELGWSGIVGNTDELLWRSAELAVQERRAPQLTDLLHMLFRTYAPVTVEWLGKERVGWLRELPELYPEQDLALVHARPGDLWRAPAPDAPDEELIEAYAPLDAAIAVYCHIHIPFVRQIDGLTVANSGSVGSPFDGDPRASYLVVEEGTVEIVRVEYDVEREVAALLASGYPDVERIAEMRRQGRFVPVSP
jgi:putative phosphoesterase